MISPQERLRRLQDRQRALGLLVAAVVLFVAPWGSWVILALLRCVFRYPGLPSWLTWYCVGSVSAYVWGQFAVWLIKRDMIDRSEIITWQKNLPNL